MKLTRENIQPDSGSSFACIDFDLPAFDAHYHYHPEIELTWILQSEGQRLIGDNLSTFAPGDFVLIGSNVPHQYRNWEPRRAHSLVIQFRQDMFGSGFLELPEFRTVRALLDNSARGLRFSESTRTAAQKQVKRLHSMEPGSHRILQLIELLHLLSEDHEAQPIASLAYAEPVKHKKMDRLERVLNYLEAHWQESIPLAEISKVAALHPQSMSRFFRQHLGMSFQDYLIQLRVSRAARQLLESDRTIVDIAFDCGFNNLANFNRHFQTLYNQTPSQYRQK
ncbi:MAG: helix-turn-helix domain-containing protein [Opitutaceae bacterium]